MVAEQAQETGLAGRYANAVFALAQEGGTVDALTADFARIEQLIGENRDLANLIKAPIYSRAQKGAVMAAVLDKLNVAPLTRRFILTLAAKHRLFALANMIAAYGRLVARLKGEVRAEVTSARALSDSETAQIKTVLKEKLGREPKLDAHVDPALLGGFAVKLGSRMIDSSLRTKLNSLRLVMRG